MQKVLSLVLALVLSLFAVTGITFAEEKKTIAGLVHCENQWAAMLLAGMEAAANEYGFDFVNANYNSDAVREAELVNTYVTQGVVGMIGSPSQTSASVYKEAVEAGVTVGFVNGAIDNDDFSVTFVRYDNHSLGIAAAEGAVDYIKENFDGKPVWHRFRYNPGTDCDMRGDAAIEVFTAEFGEEYGKPISESSTKDSAEAMQQATDAMTANPDINVIVCENEDQYNGARAAILALGKEDSVICTAVDCSVAMCKHILDPEDKILQGCGAQNSYEMGYQGCKNLCETILGTRTDYEPGKVEYMVVPKLNKANLEGVQEFLDILNSFE